MPGGDNSSCTSRFGLVVLLVFAPATVLGAPYGVPLWGQKNDFWADYDNALTDLCQAGTESPLTYGVLAASDDIWRGMEFSAGGSFWMLPEAYDWKTGPDHVGNRGIFMPSDYTDIADGSNHCAPTSFGMAHSYWSLGLLPPKSTISNFAQRMDTNDINTAMNSGDHLLHYGTHPADQVTAVRSESPGAPWAGRYESAILWSGGAPGPDADDRTHYYGEIRAGRPCKVSIPGHATMGIDFNPLAGTKVNDPWTPSVETHPWADVRNFISMQPHRLPDDPAGTRVYFSNDNFGTGQANAQAPAGDAGDLFGSDLNARHGRVMDDVPKGLAPAGKGDYNAGTVTSGLQNPFDLGDIDVLVTIQPMKYLTFSLDHGDPNPHDWVPGLSEGSPSYQAQELYCVPAPTPYLTLGSQFGYLAGVDADEEQLGLNRGEWALPRSPLDDDVDAVELEFNLPEMAYCVDYVDTRVFPDPEYPATLNTGWLLQEPNWHELPWRDPTDVYGAFPVDGETELALMDGTQLDAIQFLIDPATGKIGLFYSVNLIGDAPDMRDASGNFLDPGMIYLSWLDGQLPIPYMYIGGDVDAITWSGLVPEPALTGVLVLVAGVLRQTRVASSNTGKQITKS